MTSDHFKVALTTAAIFAVFIVGYAYFIGAPLAQASKGMAAAICQSWHLNCYFGP